MFSKINISNIVIDHIRTLKNHETKKYHFPDFVLFFASPLLVAGLALGFCGSLSDSLVTLLITSLSIFAALLFNLLLLVYDAIRKEDKKNKKELRMNFLKQIFSNISFCVFISVVTVVFLLIYSQISTLIIPSAVFTFLIYYLATLFILTLLMVLKRTHVLLSTEA